MSLTRTFSDLMRSSPSQYYDLLDRVAGSVHQGNLHQAVREVATIPSGHTSWHLRLEAAVEQLQGAAMSDDPDTFEML
ncbi:hypothetical protein ACSFA0_25125 [Variovorax sp. LT1P1]|uniref:hypothetical protein n=1 Tax=Variovorax sp. LT1P1 TaxID=3443730 RepID=UPI003F44A30B